MVKIQTKTTRKKAKGNRPDYICKQHLIPVPTSQNKQLTPFLKKDLQFSMSIKKDILNVTLKKEDSVENPDENT
jgi:hypothetical protein